MIACIAGFYDTGNPGILGVPAEQAAITTPSDGNLLNPNLDAHKIQVQ
jgi:hypothetical protein